MGKLTPFLWFDTQLEEAMEFYAGIFPDAEIIETHNFGGQVTVATFRLAGQEFRGMNAGPQFPFTDAISFWIDCVDQAEVDYYWDALLAGGGHPEQCGWLRDQFGLAWQVVPRRLPELMTDPDPERARRTMDEMMTQVKLDVAALERAADGA
ncbi:MAG TPA: VOC family protein [Pseudolysinimonas sp.]|nr:VOC family protein [Pseudolysinimonas sp.]